MDQSHFQMKLNTVSNILFEIVFLRPGCTQNLRLTSLCLLNTVIYYMIKGGCYHDYHLKFWTCSNLLLCTVIKNKAFVLAHHGEVGTQGIKLKKPLHKAAYWFLP